MRYRRFSNLMLLGVVLPTGCASPSLRPFKWLRHRAPASEPMQNLASGGETLNTESLSAVPAKLPPGIELPPEPMVHPQTLPSGATQPADSSSSSVIFASAPTS